LVTGGKPFVAINSLLDMHYGLHSGSLNYTAHGH